jgi:hypothetical protein
MATADDLELVLPVELEREAEPVAEGLQETVVCPEICKKKRVYNELHFTTDITWLSYGIVRAVIRESTVENKGGLCVYDHMKLIYTGLSYIEGCSGSRDPE